jgi:hypothetical protein
MRMGKRISGAMRTVGGALIVVPLVGLLAGGPSLGWVWVGSQLQGGTEPSGTAIVTVIAGMTLTYGLIAMAFAWIKGRGQTSPREPVRYAWNRSLRDERARPLRTHVLEDVVVVATVVVATVVTVWFFFFGHPGVPIGY